MSRKLFVMHAEGLGNCVEIIPCLRTLKEVLNYELNYWHVFSSFNIPKIIPYVDKWFYGNEFLTINPDDYIGKVSTDFAKGYINIKPINKLSSLSISNPVSSNRSEVDTYMDIARDLGVKEKDIIWEGECLYNQSYRGYDVVIHNGYNHKSSNKKWQWKSYPQYPEVVKMLDGYSVCSIGSPEEYIKGTDDMTGKPLLDTLGIIKNSAIFLGNDSAFYHFSNALQVPNIVIFTFTSTVKNYDKRFHKYSTIIRRDDLECIGCQNTIRFKICKERVCRDIDPAVIALKVSDIIHGK